MTQHDLFQAVKLGPYELANHIVMAPLTSRTPGSAVRRRLS